MASVRDMPAELLKAALDLCRDAFAYPGSWSVRTNMIYKMYDAFETMWGTRIYEECRSNFSFICIGFQEACSSFKVMGIQEQSGSTLVSVLRWHCGIQMTHARKCLGFFEELGDKAQMAAVLDLAFVYPFNKLYLGILRKEAQKLGDQDALDLCRQALETNEELYSAVEAEDSRERLNSVMQKLSLMTFFSGENG